MSSRLLTVFHRAPPSVRVVTWMLVPFAALHVVLATISGYRAIVQMYDVHVDTPADSMRVGDILMLHVTTSGRTPVDAEVMLERGRVADTLGMIIIHDHANPSYDPRPIHASLRMVLTAADVARFPGGAAKLRAVANGRSQWLRVPPPVVFERNVTLGRAEGYGKHH